MKKWQIYILVAFVTVSIASAAPDCERTVTTNEVPCAIITTWEYTNNCDTYTIKFFNQSGDQVGQHLLEDYGNSNRCNVSFNFSEVGSYIYNISSGDTGRILVEVDDTMNLSIILALSVFGIAFIGIGLYLFFNRGK